ncbi:hypothetical protein H4J51_13975 [Colwellia sp. MB02u-18]|uniref:hypothetical protein n=1 Tax=unclassified Colwellia TaxID=196834 RepID=UPI0015F6D035|nr:MULTISPECIES: hypothetical protein [unclassified Colwellia]MBA6225026.1 hypothetical protein [Colwellia sp. MB3u-45]MBA6268686.1 hypothetical protein [Colwellia sp. MB3u-43]MBA6321117.1 hypothetical protein [Colwellia sp. MB02u-19]MBA6325670.1 hypothetical protein [Colwellia sp. MB02u-18]MBA6332145.1 hypothetical protein [Colwellia sp. MB02u-12]
MNPDYTKYTLVELYDVKDNIDKKCYPERYDLLLNEIRKREKNPENEPKPLKLINKKDKAYLKIFLMFLCIPFFSWQLINAYKYGVIHSRNDHVLHLNSDPIGFYVVVLIHASCLVIALSSVFKGLSAK